MPPILILGGHSDIRAHSLVRHLVSHCAMTSAGSYRVGRVLVEVLLHVRPRRLHIVIPLVVEGCLSPLLRNISYLFTHEAFVIGPLHLLMLIPVLTGLLKVLHPLL